MEDIKEDNAQFYNLLYLLPVSVSTSRLINEIDFKISGTCYSTKISVITTNIIDIL